jgi:hypothetical protein
MPHKEMMQTTSHPLWHLLQVSDVLDLEFATALSQSVSVLTWEPQRSWLPFWVKPGNELEHKDESSSVRIRNLPLLRGFSKFPFSMVANIGSTLTQRLLHQTPFPQQSPLICTVPFFAPVAERWPGPVVYWLTDLIAEYASTDRLQVEGLDRRLCQAATIVCPNSLRLSDYLVQRAGCNPAKIQIVPNATREINILPSPPSAPMERPPILQTISKPIVGIIGNLASNMDWILLERVIRLVPELAWVFVGPTSMSMPDREARRARDSVIQHPNAHFVGKQPYGALASFARCFSVAMLPYRRCEPTYSGSSTRFYEHLAACRPMIATRGLEELNHKPPLLTLVDTAEEAAEALEQLRAKNFDDGLAELRWKASLEGTWQKRAATVQLTLAAKLGETTGLLRPALQ